MPAQFEADPDNVFSMAFGLSINQKKIKKMEKEYKTMKSKENEDEVEIRVSNFNSFLWIYFHMYMKCVYTFFCLQTNADDVQRLRGEARLLRQRMDALEAECGSLADSLLQGQVLFKEEVDDEGVKEDHGNDHNVRMDLTSCFSSR